MVDFRGFANFVFGCTAVFASRFVFGLDWIFAILLFVPASGLSKRIFDNDGEGMAKYGFMLFLYPFVVLLTPSIVRLFTGKVSQQGGEAGMIVLSAVIAAVLLLGIFLLASFVAKCIGDFSFSKQVHRILAFAVLLCACLLAIVGTICLMQIADARIIKIPKPLKLVLPLMLTSGFVFMLRRMFTGKMLEPAIPASRPSSPSSVRFEAKSDVKMSRVVGMENAKEQIRLRLIEPVRDPRRARQYGLKIGGGVLLYGPPGTGKTMLARAVAGELNLPFYMITAADIFGKYVGESERNLKRIFSEIRKNAISVVFIDELETLFPKRTEDVHETTRKVISLLLQELDGLDTTKNPILMLGATNVPWMVDEAFLRPGRFDVKIFVDLPDAEARRKMLITAFAKGEIPHEPGLTAYMANRTKNYSGADLNGVMDRLRQLAYARNAKCYVRALADEAIASVSPSANGTLMDQIHDWEATAMPEVSGNAGSGGARVAVRPDVTLADVAGMNDVKEQIRMRLIEPMRHATLASLYEIKVGGGMLLYGPPGTGKTFLAKAVAGELSLPFFTITAADIFGKFVGESERNVRRLFREIRKNELSVVFIDELEAIFPKRTDGVHETTRKVISFLLQELDGLDATKNPILLLGATNVPWMVDEAFLRPGRFDVCIYVGAPDLEARRYMVYNALEHGKVAYEEGLVDHIAQRTDNYSGADLKGVVDRLKQAAFSKRLSYYTKSLADEVLAESHPTISAALVKQIEEWKRDQGVLA